METNKGVDVFVNDVSIGHFTAKFTTRGYGGVILLNGWSNVAQFRNFDISPKF